MAFPDYKKHLLSASFDSDFVLNRYFHCGLSSVFMGAHPNEEVEFTNIVAATLFKTFAVPIHPLQIVVCGSAHLGFSPVPGKLGKPFDPKTSDIDLAVIAPEIFDAWWTELQSAGLGPPARHEISKGLFWGFIDPFIARDLSDYGRRWWEAFGSLHTDRAKGVRGRLYRNLWSMQSYHRVAVIAARKKLLAESGVMPSNQDPASIGPDITN